MEHTSNNEIVVVGSCMIDFVSYAPRLPLRGETIHGTKFVTSFGGKGANQCVAAAKLGGKTKLIARVGEDMWGDQYIKNLKHHNVNVDHVKKTNNCTSGIAQINVSDEGHNQIVIVAGANLKLSVEDIEAARKNIESAAVVVCQLETCAESSIRAMELCKGISILNGAPAMKRFDKRLLTLPTIFCVNESEASTFSQLPVNNLEEGGVACKKLLEMGCNVVILTVGAEGALYATKDRPAVVEHINAVTVKCVDSTGAGDAFIGALAYLLANKREMSMIKQIEVACKIASDTVTRIGTQSSYPGADIFERIG